MIWYINGQPLTKNQECAVPLGVQGDNETTAYTADCSDWLAAWPNGIIALLLKAPDGSDAYVANTATDAETGVVTWTITAFDTAITGYGWGELRIVQADEVKKSWTFRTYIRPSILAEVGTPPAPTPDWVDDLLEEASTAMGATRANAELAAEAADDAKDAQEAAETAQGKAEDAQEAAEAAQGRAETAQGKAEDAQEAAETAQGKAETAQGKAEDAQGAAEAAVASIGDSVQNAEAWAAGTRDGDPVTSGDPAYHNNAKYYSTQASSAQNAAETAQGKAEDAQTAAETAQGKSEDAAEDAEAWAAGTRNGSDVGGSDPAYHNNAKYYAEQAGSLVQNGLTIVAPEYDATQTYAVGEYVRYSGDLYRCTTDISTAEAWTAAHWEATDVGEELKSQSDTMGDLSNLTTSAKTNLVAAINEAAQTGGGGGGGGAGVVANLYNSAETYAVGDYVIYEDALYRCITAIDTAEAWTAAHWVETVVGTELKHDRDVINSVFPVNLAYGVSYTNKRTINYSNGNVTNSTSSALNASDYIDISGCTQILYQHGHIDMGSTTKHGMAFYNSSKAWVSGIIATRISGTTYFTLEVADVPENAVYCRITCPSTGPEVYNKADYDAKINSRLSKLETSAATVENDAVPYLDEKINTTQNWIDYGYGSVREVLEASGDASTAGHTGVDRYRTRVKLNETGGGTTSGTRRIKITGTLERSYASTAPSSWIGELQLVEGRQYAISVRKISGTATLNNEPYIVGVAAYISGAGTAISTSTVVKSTPEEEIRTFTAPAEKINIVIVINKEAVLTNFVVDVQLYEIYGYELTGKTLFGISGTTAQSNIAQGEYFAYGESTICQATAAIASGEAFVIGTNCVKVPLETVLNTLAAAIAAIGS